MSKFARIRITQIIRDSAQELGIPIIAIFRAADVDHTNMNKWEHAASPTRRTEDKILDAIEKLQKKKCSDDIKKRKAPVGEEMRDCK